MKIWKGFYYLVFAVIIIIALLLIVSAFPIPGNFQIKTVQSGSMEPAIQTGGLVVVKPTENYQEGDVVTFFGEDSYETVTHRITSVQLVEGEPRYVTKGDANENEDREKISREQIIGKVILDLPYLGYVVNFAKTPIGFALIVIVPASIFIYEELRKIFVEAGRIRREKKSEKNKEEAKEGNEDKK
jgi:signal peptidase